MKKLIVGLLLLACGFTSLADIIPQGATASKIQSAINAAALEEPAGTVVLDEGLFEIDQTLALKGGVTLKGQGWDKTTIRPAEGVSIRCVSIEDGSKLEGVTLTGGNSDYGAGARVKDGKISWCWIKDNTTTAGSKAGAGISFSEGQGTVDHSIVSGNTIADGCWGAGIGAVTPNGPVLLDACLIYGNVNPSGSAGGVGIDNPRDYAVTIRNCTITGNAGAFNTGGVYFYNVHTGSSLVLINSIIADNKLNGGDGTNLKIGNLDAVNSKNCFFGKSSDAAMVAGSISGDPLFVDAANGDYHLAEGSTAIGAGANYEGIGNDLENFPFAVPPTIGCYESCRVVAQPVFTPGTTTFDSSISVTLSCSTRGAEIRYTLDGMDPDETSELYAEPIVISEQGVTTIMARAFRAEMEPSETVSATYTYAVAEPPELGAVTATPTARTVEINGTVDSVGNNGAMACDVYLAYGPAGDELPEGTLIASGVKNGETFRYLVRGLSVSTAYDYSVKIVNNALSPLDDKTSGSFTTEAQAKIPQPAFGTFSKAFDFTTAGYAGSETLTNFPVLVRLSEDSPMGFSYADAKADGSDIRFADEAGNELACEIDTWNAGGESLIWVKIQSLTSETTFRMYYGGAAEDPMTPAAVWNDAGYAGVWHMGEANGSVADATGHGLTATPNGDASAAYADKAPLGVARAMGASERGYLSIPNYDSLALGNTFTMSGWVRGTGVSGYVRIFSRKNDYMAGNGWELEVPLNSYISCSARGASATAATGQFLDGGFENKWLHVAVVYDGATATVYGNGVEVARGGIAAATDNGQQLCINSNSKGEEGYARGAYDECRLKDGAASADWVKAEYDQGVASTEFLTAGEILEVEEATVVSKPVFRPAEGTIYEPTDVTIECPTTDATVYYTVDGAEPTTESTPYEGPIAITATTTIKAIAVKGGMSPSKIATATYTYEDPVGPVFGEVVVTPKSTFVSIFGSIASIGNNYATGCDISLSLDGGAAMPIATGKTGSFSYVIKNLEPESTHSYTLSIVNNAKVPMTGLEKSGMFTTTAPGKGIEPIPYDPEGTRESVQDAIDAAALEEPAGTVILDEGLFEIDQALTLKGGITLKGQGWDKTTIRPAEGVSIRCVSIEGGSKLEGVTLTGGNFDYGAGAHVKNGTISWCKISGNNAKVAGTSGGGVSFSSGCGTIDHSIVIGNTITGGSWGAGIGGIYSAGAILIDTCLVYGNEDLNGSGGGIGFQKCNATVTIRSSTVTANKCSNGNGHGLYFNDCQTNGRIALVNDILTGNGIANAECNTFIAKAYFDEENSANCLLTGSGAKFSEEIYKDADMKNLIAGVVDADPVFVDPAGGDFHLAKGSPAIDAGAELEVDVDLDNIARPQNKGFDIGCYEVPGTGLLMLVR